MRHTCVGRYFNSLYVKYVFSCSAVEYIDIGLVPNNGAECLMETSLI